MSRIALVDDDRNILTSVAMTLENEGFEVETFNDGQSALDAFNKSMPDMAVLDITDAMPTTANFLGMTDRTDRDAAIAAEAAKRKAEGRKSRSFATELKKMNPHQSPAYQGAPKATQAERRMDLEANHHYPSRRSAVAADNIVSTSHPLAAQAGLSMLARGGNAVDAALAAAITLTVVEPTGNGIGSDAFAIVWDGSELHGLNASGRSAAGWRAERFAGQDTMPFRGWETVTVPGAVSSWVALSDRFGKLAFETLFEPAIGYASDGFPVSPIIATLWQRAEELVAGKGLHHRQKILSHRVATQQALFDIDLQFSFGRIGIAVPVAGAQPRHAPAPQHGLRRCGQKPVQPLPQRFGRLIHQNLETAATDVMERGERQIGQSRTVVQHHQGQDLTGFKIIDIIAKRLNALLNFFG